MFFLNSLHCAVWWADFPTSLFSEFRDWKSAAGFPLGSHVQLPCGRCLRFVLFWITKRWHSSCVSYHTKLRFLFVGEGLYYNLKCPFSLWGVLHAFFDFSIWSWLWHIVADWCLLWHERIFLSNVWCQVGHFFMLTWCESSCCSLPFSLYSYRLSQTYTCKALSCPTSTVALPLGKVLICNWFKLW